MHVRTINRMLIDAAELSTHAKRISDAKWEEIPGSVRNSIPELVRRLHSRNSRLSRAAVWALGRNGPRARRAVPDLLRIFKGHDSYLKRKVTEALAQIRHVDEEIMTALIIQRHDPAVLPAVVSTCKALGKPLRRRLLSFILSRWEQCQGKMAKAGLKVSSAIFMLGYAGPGGAQDLMKLVRTHYGIRQWAIISLNGAGSKARRIITFLKGVALTDPSPSTRCEAVLTLIRLVPADKDIVDICTKDLQDEDDYMAAASANALCILGPLAASSVPSLKKAAETGIAYKKKCAADAIWWIENQPAFCRRVLTEIATNKESFFREAAILALILRGPGEGLTQRALWKMWKEPRY